MGEELDCVGLVVRVYNVHWAEVSTNGKQARVGNVHIEESASASQGARPNDKPTAA